MHDDESHSNRKLRARFIRYLLVSMEHYMGKYCEKKRRQNSYEMPFEVMNGVEIPDLDASHVSALDMISQLESEELCSAMQKLTPREQYVMLVRAVEGRPFKEIAATLRLSYKGTSAIYYRAKAKVKKYLEAMK